MSEASAKTTISEDYRRQQQELHLNPDYGIACLTFASRIADLIGQLKAKSLTDYGAGKQRLKAALGPAAEGLDYRPYDPAFPEYGPARSADLVCCIDVLEHIEPRYLDTVLDELAELTTTCGFFTIHTGPALKQLGDGRNAHLTQQPSSWWIPKICERFELNHLQRTTGGFFLVVAPRVRS
jgi:hypothetical protein